MYRYALAPGARNQLISFPSIGLYRYFKLTACAFACHTSAGNHDLDNGVEVLKQRVGETNFPWIISNVWEKQTTTARAEPEQRTLLAGLNSIHVLTRGGIKFGFMGLASWDWIPTLTQPTLDSIEYTDFTSTAHEVARTLRQDHNCDFVIALTHMRTPEDVEFTRSSIADLVLGGHDHVLHKELIDRTWLVKSGTDFKVRCPVESLTLCLVSPYFLLTST